MKRILAIFVLSILFCFSSCNITENTDNNPGEQPQQHGAKIGNHIIDTTVIINDSVQSDSANLNIMSIDTQLELSVRSGEDSVTSTDTLNDLAANNRGSINESEIKTLKKPVDTNDDESYIKIKESLFWLIMAVMILVVIVSFTNKWIKKSLKKRLAKNGLLPPKTTETDNAKKIGQEQSVKNTIKDVDSHLFTKLCSIFKNDKIRKESDLLGVIQAMYNENGTLKQQVDQLNEEKKDLVKKQNNYDNYKEEVGEWRNLGYANPEKARTEIDNLKKQLKEALEKNKKYEILKENIKNNPKSYKGDEEYKKLSDLIVKSEMADDMCNNPDLIDKDSRVGKLVKKGLDLEQYLKTPLKVLETEDQTSELVIRIKKSTLFDNIKNDVSMIMDDAYKNEFQGTHLKNLLGFINSPETIIGTKYTDCGLYELMTAIESISSGGTINLNSIKYDWFKNKTSIIIENSNQYLEIESIADGFGKDNVNSNRLKENIKIVFDSAIKYLQFEQYKNYWKNIYIHLLSDLNGLYANDDIYNNRLLLFYASQLYSISCIMGKVYGDYQLSTTRFEKNISVFNNNDKPSINQYGIPEYQIDLKDYLFEYKGDQDEDSKVNYLKNFKPLPFIFINSYYSEDILK